MRSAGGYQPTGALIRCYASRRCEAAKQLLVNAIRDRPRMKSATGDRELLSVCHVDVTLVNDKCCQLPIKMCLRIQLAQ